MTDGVGAEGAGVNVGNLELGRSCSGERCQAGLWRDCLKEGWKDPGYRFSNVNNPFSSSIVLACVRVGFICTSLAQGNVHALKSKGDSVVETRWLLVVGASTAVALGHFILAGSGRTVSQHMGTPPSLIGSISHFRAWRKSLKSQYPNPS